MWVQYAPNLLKPKKCLWVGNDSRKSPSRVIFPSGCSRIDQGFMHPKLSQHFPRKKQNRTNGMKKHWKKQVVPFPSSHPWPYVKAELVAAAAVAPGPSCPINGRRPRTSRGWHGHQRAWSWWMTWMTWMTWWVSSIRIDPFTVIPETVRLTDQTSRLATSRTVIIEQQMTARYQ